MKKIEIMSYVLAGAALIMFILCLIDENTPCAISLLLNAIALVVSGQCIRMDSRNKSDIESLCNVIIQLIELVQKKLQSKLKKQRNYDKNRIRSQIRELKAKMRNALSEVAIYQSEVKEEIAAKHRQIGDIYKDISKLNASLQGYHQKRIALQQEWTRKLNAFIRENQPNTTSNLAEAETSNIIYELRRRGFEGVVTLQDKETGEVFASYDIQKQFGNERQYEESEREDAAEH